MSTEFRWPNQLMQQKTKPTPKAKLQKRYVLVRKLADVNTGKHKTSSSSDGLIDIAAAVHLGLIPSAGLPGLLLNINQQRVRRLIKHNTVALIKPKKATTTENHATKSKLKLAEKALTTVIGPAYWEANKHLGAKAALKTRLVIPWIKRTLEDVNSPLCTSLVGTKYEDLIGIRHSRRWWLDLLGLRQNVQSNLTP